MVCTLSGKLFGHKKGYSSDISITWMKLENIMLSEIRQKQKENIVWFHLYEISRREAVLETESRLEDNRDRG